MLIMIIMVTILRVVEQNNYNANGNANDGNGVDEINFRLFNVKGNCTWSFLT